jgi:hypothetical protein
VPAGTCRGTAPPDSDFLALLDASSSPGSLVKKVGTTMGLGSRCASIAVPRTTDPWWSWRTPYHTLASSSVRASFCIFALTACTNTDFKLSVYRELP